MGIEPPPVRPPVRALVVRGGSLLLYGSFGDFDLREVEVEEFRGDVLEAEGVCGREKEETRVVNRRRRYMYMYKDFILL